MKYRSEIDGLRAIAVIPVILFHAGFSLFKGGFVGVDIFFVISGYLITTIIYKEINAGTFSFLYFYERRIRRIFPALFVVSFICIPFAWFWLVGIEYKRFSQSLATINIFSSNILFWSQGGYFSPNTALKPLLHTWSLAVEEQFYIFFPLLLLWKRIKGKQLLVLSIIFLLSLSWSEYSSALYPDANFYLLPSRAWELLAGSILAIILPRVATRNLALSQVGALLGFGMIIYAISSFSESDFMPNRLTLTPVIGTILVIAFADKRTVIGKILGFKLIVGIGLMSYSAYLWHQPLFAFARIRLVGAVSSDIYIGLVFCTLGLAYLTWRFIEAPFRKKGRFTRRQVFFTAILGAVFFIAFGLTGVLTKGLPDRISGEARYYADFANKYKPTRGEVCYSNRKGLLLPPQEKCIYNTEFPLNVALWGDSHAGAIMDPLAEDMALQEQGLIEIVYLGCPPVIGFKQYSKVDTCNQFNIESLKYLEGSHIQTVVLLARWARYIEGKRFNNGEGGIEAGSDNGYGLPISKGRPFIHDKEYLSAMGAIYRSTAEALLNVGKQVVLVYPIPEAGWNVPDLFTKIYLHNYEPLKNSIVSTSFDVFQARTKNVYAQLDKLPPHPNLLKIYPEHVFCNSTVKGRCILELNKKPLYSDDDHLNYLGGELVSREIIKGMKAKHWL